jgi:hypothetical protein
VSCAGSKISLNFLLSSGTSSFLAFHNVAFTMKSLLLFSLLAPLVYSQDMCIAGTKLDPTQPIYLGEVFWPPSMTLIAWLPSKEWSLTEWCYLATDITEGGFFSLGGVDALESHDYFTKEAYITRAGKRFADCYVTPESGRIGTCTGVEDYNCEGGQEFTGPGTRRWSCWVTEEVKRGLKVEKKNIYGEHLTDAKATPTAETTGTPLSNSIASAFTAGVTGS